jgi:fructosamine-3-kinase
MAKLPHSPLEINLSGLNAYLPELISEVLQQPVTAVDSLSGGCIAEVYRVRLADGTAVVAKYDAQAAAQQTAAQPAAAQQAAAQQAAAQPAAAQLALEGYMLRYLAEHSRLPLPAVIHSDDRLLILEFLPGGNSFAAAAQTHAAELLADLHNITAVHFGLERDTLIGGLPQPNPWTASWLAFFRDQRLVYMSRAALQAGRLPAAVAHRVETFAGHLDRWLSEPAQPSLIHGDAWTGNILARDGRITGFIDPAIYYADAEIELAFTTLFGTFSTPFFKRYQEIRPIAPGFMEERRDIYNLYPLLVHVRLFGGGYVHSVEQTLRRFGF